MPTELACPHDLIMLHGAKCGNQFSHLGYLLDYYKPYQTSWSLFG